MTASGRPEGRAGTGEERGGAFPSSGAVVAADAAADPDVQAMLAFQRGDEAAFIGLVERYTKPLVNYFYFQCRDQAQAEDFTQDIWTKVFRSRGDYRAGARFATWLFRVARNYWIDQCRSRRRRPTTSNLRGASDDDELEPLRAMPSPRDARPGEGLERAELAERLAWAVARLPEDMRDVFVLGEVQGLPYAEVAHVLEIPLGTVKSRMFHAVRKLRDLLMPYVGEGP